MTLDDFDNKPADNTRKEKRRQEDKRLMAYRRAIEDYRESRALHELVCDYPDPLSEASRAQATG